MDLLTAALSSVARQTESRIVLLVLDGLGDIRTEELPQTPLEMAMIPTLDRLAREGVCGRMIPVAPGLTPGSGAGHLALFGYDPLLPEHQIGRGVLEALGLGLKLSIGDLAVRGNFCTLDAEGRVSDRRAGRISTEATRELCGRLQDAIPEVDGVRVQFHPGEGHRFVALFPKSDLSPEVTDSDPQQSGVPPRSVEATGPDGERTANLANRLVERCVELLEEERANGVLLRGFSRPPSLEPLTDRYRLRPAALAAYPLYRGVAQLVGMEVLEAGKGIDEAVTVLADQFDDFDFFFVHVKPTDQAGEDGNAKAKAAVLEEVDRALPKLLDLRPDVLIVTGDHSTPAAMRSHSWHPVPVLLHSRWADADGVEVFTEQACLAGGLGLFRARELLGLALAHAGKLEKFWP